MQISDNIAEELLYPHILK